MTFSGEKWIFRIFDDFFSSGPEVNALCFRCKNIHYFLIPGPLKSMRCVLVVFFDVFSPHSQSAVSWLSIQREILKSRQNPLLFSRVYPRLEPESCEKRNLPTEFGMYRSRRKRFKIGVQRSRPWW